jgi:hypothetical protein
MVKTEMTFDEARAACEADPFFAPLCIHEPDMLLGDGGKRRKDKMLDRMKLTLIWHHVCALDTLEEIDDDLRNKLTAIDKDPEAFAQRFVNHFVSDEPVVRSLFLTTIGSGWIGQAFHLLREHTDKLAA